MRKGESQRESGTMADKKEIKALVKEATRDALAKTKGLKEKLNP